jgi:DNA mismatch repair ATPase MutS
MRADKTTLYDLAIFHKEEEFSLFHRIDFTKSQLGKAALMRFFSEPLDSFDEISQVQEILHIIGTNINNWPDRITNGTLLVIDKYLDDNPSDIPEEANVINGFFYKWLHPADYSMILFSVKQFFELIKGYEAIHVFFSEKKKPAKLSFILNQTEKILSHPKLLGLKNKSGFNNLNIPEMLFYGRFFHVEFVKQIRTLCTLYATLDAWYSMAMANQELNLIRPTFLQDELPAINATKLRHLLLEKPVSYDVQLNQEKNFIFLTGANMAGKSTLIKSLGLSVYLAHMGMGVPAEKMEMTLFDGILSNINVEDNIIKGESYFFNEVKRIRNTVTRINDGKRWLVLIDELFKGTNIQDAMKCSLAVITGLINMKNGLFILSTHLYEIGEELKKYPSISFKYFETKLEENELSFSYQLKDGISQDRMGYLILQKEGVIDLLNNIGKNTD